LACMGPVLKDGLAWAVLIQFQDVIENHLLAP
jgi:hypothetical protein